MIYWTWELPKKFALSELLVAQLCWSGQRRPQINARQVLAADQSGHCGGIDRMLGATTPSPSLIRADEELKMAI
jgi:hypothetical protein